MARNKKVEILSNDKEVLHPMTDGDCVIFEDGQTLTQKLSEDDSVKYTPEIVNSSPMFKVGEGNTVDYSDNVLDGAYERATLQGQTYVNYIQESSADEVTLPTHFDEYERTQHKTLTSNEEGTLGINLVGQSYVNALQHDSEEEFVVLGESLEFQEKKVEYTNEGQIKSAMLKGQTLVNLAQTKFGTSGSNVNLTKTEIKNGMTYTIPNQATGYITIRTFAHELLKPSTTYTILFEIVENTVQDYNGITVSGTFDSYFGRGERQLYLSNTFDLSVGKKRLVVTTHNDISTYDGFGFGFPGFPRSGKEDAGVFTIKNVMVIEGDHSNEDIPYFEGMQSVTVSTKLENLCHKHTTSDLAKNGKTFTTASLEDRCILLVDYRASAEATYGMKPNTKYLVQFQISNLVLDGLEGIGLHFAGTTDSSNRLFENSIIRRLVTENGIYRVVLTTTDLTSTSSVEIKGLADEWENSGSTLRSLTISNIMYVEYQNGMENWDLPYFEDYQVMKPIQVESVNKNLLEVPNISITTKRGVKVETNEGVFKITGTSDGSGGRNDLYNEHGRLFSLSFKKGKTYTTSIIDLVENGNVIDGFFISDSETGTVLFGCNSLNNFIYTYTPLIDMDVHFGINVLVNETYNSTFKVLIEESDTATSYVPHQSKTTYSWDEVVLRKVGDVEDTLDLTTGEWVQRIGEIVFDGSDDEVWRGNNGTTTTTNRFIFSGLTDSGVTNDSYSLKQCLCDKLQTMMWSETSPLGVTVSTTMVFLYNNSIDYSVSALRTWLQSNPITVQYELAKPIVHKVNLSRPNLQTYDDITHVHTKYLDGTLIPNIYLPSSISYPAILEPNTTYNVCVNHTEVSADNPLKVNVGGTEITMTDSRMTLTTPTTLAHSNVLFMGKGNKIKESMLIKNSSLLTGDLPHFNGIGSVQLGKTIENLCDSTDSMYGGCVATKTVYNDHVSVTVTKTGSLVICSSLIRPLENGKKYFVYAPNTFPTANACYVGFYNYYNDTPNFGHQVKSVQTGKCIIEIDQKDKLYTRITLGYHGYLSTGTYTIQRPIICEYQLGMEDWDWESIGYFTGTKNIGNEFMKVQNKNLFDGLLESGIIDANGELRNTSNYGKRTVNYINVKPNTKYTLLATKYTNSLYVHEYDENLSNIQEINIHSTTPTFTTTSNTYHIKFNSHDSVEMPNDSTIQLEESSTATTYTAHKHNGLYITKDQLIDLTWEQGAIFYESGVSWSQMTNNVNSMRIRTPQPLNLEPNKTYRVSLGNDKYQYGIQLYDNSNNGVFDYGWNTNREFIFTTTKDKHKVGIAIGKIDSSNSTPITPPESVHAQVRLEEVTDVVLRGIGDVHDELDITRGKYIQRIGEITINGENNFYIAYHPSNNPIEEELSPYGRIHYTTPNADGGWSNEYFMSSQVISHCRDAYYANKANCIGIDGNGYTYISLDHNLFGDTREGVLEYLKQHPITYSYRLKTPIVHKVHIGNKNEANTEVTKPNGVFTLPTLYTEQTHIDLTNNGIIPKVQSRDYIAYPIPPMLTKTYTLQHNLTGGVSNLTVDLLGRTQEITYQNHKSLVYTPETMDAILHHELRISGKGKISRVTYVDGGYMDRDIPYFEGMKNAVNPIVKNVGKNLFDGELEIGSIYLNNGVNYDSIYTIRTKNFVPIKSSTQYILKNDKNYDQNIIFYDEQQRAISHCTNTIVFITPINAKYLRFRCAEHLEQKDLNTKFQLEEGSVSTPYIEYKENVCYVDCGEIRLTPNMFVQGSINNNSASDSYETDKNTAKTRIRTKELIELEPGEQYVFLGDPTYLYSMHFYDKNGMKVGIVSPYDLSWKGNVPFTIRTDAPKAAIIICKANQSSITPSELDQINFQLVKVSEIKQMRSLPNGVHDEIDLETGKYVQRVGEIVFNGDTKFDDWGERGENGLTFNYYDPQVKQLENEKVSVFADTLLGTNLTTTWDGTPYTVAQADNGNYLQICLNKNDLRENTRDGINDYFLQNPVTIQYELATPIVKDIVIHNYPHSYEGGHVIIENGDPNTPIPAQLTYRVVTNRSGQIQQHTEQVEKQEREINELETLILANIHLSQTR